MSNMTLEEALEFGQGVERPFRCPIHEDTMASASVNVVKGVWFCHACFSKGVVDPSSKRTPTVAEIRAILEPERAGRIYPTAWLELFSIEQRPDAYWHTRFPAWVCWLLGLGEDPFSGEATFPVYTPSGQLAGVGRRAVAEKRYRYPANWSASTQMGGARGRITPVDVLCIVEGMADAVAVRETGCMALCQWGSQLHRPQIEFISRHNPKLILLGQDMDEAGERGVSLAFRQLHRVAPMKRVRWSRNDPAESPLGLRRAALAKAVGASNYGVDVIPQWERAVTSAKDFHARAMEESA